MPRDHAHPCPIGRRRALAALVAVAILGCRPDARQEVGDGEPWIVPSNDAGESCSDVGDLRACWDASGEPRVVARPLPPIAAPSPSGFRCTGAGADRTCRPRSAMAGPFVCAGAECVEAHPRQPDDGEWLCSDDAGVTVCVGSVPAAGVAAGEAEAGWICGARGGPPSPDRLGARVCVDLSPDFPEGAASGLRCRWSYEHGLMRVCRREPAAHGVGDGCDAVRPCVAGASCVASRCVPRRPHPTCWLDADCAGGTCRFGSCLEAGT